MPLQVKELAQVEMGPTQPQVRLLVYEHRERVKRVNKDPLSQVELAHVLVRSIDWGFGKVDMLVHGLLLLSFRGRLAPKSLVFQSLLVRGRLGDCGVLLGADALWLVD